jgi:DnaJ like chaperone protein
MTRLAGKLLGAITGYAASRHPIGLAIGLALGHAWDKGLFDHWLPLPGRRAGALVGPVFGLAAAIARGDGRVSEADVAAAERLMQRLDLDAAGRRRAVAAYTRGRTAGFDVDAAVSELRAFCAYRGDLKAMAMDVLVDIATAEGAVDPGALVLLQRIGRGLELAPDLIEAILARKRGAGRSRIADPYAVLGVPKSAGDDDLRLAYRRAIAQVHPDRVEASGAEPEQVEAAQRRAQEINAAWEQIRAERGIN